MRRSLPGAPPPGGRERIGIAIVPGIEPPQRERVVGDDGRVEAEGEAAQRSAVAKRFDERGVTEIAVIVIDTNPRTRPRLARGRLPV